MSSLELVVPILSFFFGIVLFLGGRPVRRQSAVLFGIGGLYGLWLIAAAVDIVPWPGEMFAPSKTAVTQVVGRQVLKDVKPVDPTERPPASLAAGLADGVKAASVSLVPGSGPQSFLAGLEADFGLPSERVRIRRAGDAEDRTAALSEWSVDAAGNIRQVDARSRRLLSQITVYFVSYLGALMAGFALWAFVVRTPDGGSAKALFLTQLAEGAVFVVMICAGAWRFGLWRANWLEIDQLLPVACGFTLTMTSWGRLRTMAFVFALVAVVHLVSLQTVAPHADLAHLYGRGGILSWDALRLGLIAVVAALIMLAVPVGSDTFARLRRPRAIVAGNAAGVDNDADAVGA